MKQIYQNSSKTIVWLGEPKSDVDTPLLGDLIDALQKSTLTSSERENATPDMIQKYPYMGALPSNRSARLAMIQTLEDNHLFRSWIDAKSEDDCTVGARRRKAIESVFNQTWFNRAWIVQEALVSPDASVVYGPTQFSFEILSRLGSLADGVAMSAHGWRQALHNVTSGYSAFRNLSQHKHSFSETGVLEESFLVFLSSMQSGSSATDPRDKVYAFLGLKTPGAAPHIIPDYRKTIAQIYSDVAISFVKESQSLAILAAVDGKETGNPDPVLGGSPVPSWVPDWSRNFSGLEHSKVLPGDNPESTYRSARGRSHIQLDPTSVAMPSSSLCVFGKTVAVITKVLSRNFDRERSYYDGKRVALPVTEIMDELEISNFPGDLETAVFRTLLADGDFNGAAPLKYPVDQLLEVHENQDKYFEAVKGSEERKIGLYLMNSSMILQRKLFFKAEGQSGIFLGLGNLFTKAGDLVCILYGSNLPVVLREDMRYEDQKNRRYKVVGLCYLDEWMFGQFPSPEWWEDFEQRPDTLWLV